MKVQLTNAELSAGHKDIQETRKAYSEESNSSKENLLVLRQNLQSLGILSACFLSPQGFCDVFLSLVFCCPEEPSGSLFRVLELMFN